MAFALSKECQRCHRIWPLDRFSPTPRGIHGRATYCRPCMAAYMRDRPKHLGRATTQKYRDTHRARWRASHRLNQFFRRSLIAASEDGTVTDGFMRKLYTTEICAYCGMKTPEEDRTADHVIPLSKGGKHSASNMVMACHQCNSTKRSEIWKPI